MTRAEADGAALAPLLVLALCGLAWLVLAGPASCGAWLVAP